MYFLVLLAYFCSILLHVLSHVLTMQAPVHTIASNAGVEGAVVVGKLLEQDNPDLGYDAAKGRRCFHNSPFICP